MTDHASDNPPSSTLAALADHRAEFAGRSLASLFAGDPARFDALSFAFDGWCVDVSKERVTARTLSLLEAHADALGLPAWRDALFAGERVNMSEQRPALHTALRAAGGAPILVDGDDVMPGIRATRARIAAMADAIRDRQPARRDRRADPRRREHRHRRIRPRPAAGVRRARRARRARRPRSFRFQRRSGASGAHAGAPLPGLDAVHRDVEDVHDAGDARQRGSRGRVALRRPSRRGRPPALRRRHRQRRGCAGTRGVGRRRAAAAELGGRALLAVVGGRTADRHRARARSHSTRCSAARRAWTRTSARHPSPPTCRSSSARSAGGTRASSATSSASSFPTRRR